MKTLKTTALTLALAAAAVTPAAANLCDEPGHGRACYGPGEIGAAEGTYIGVFRHPSGSGCPWPEGVPERILLADGTIRSNGWIGGDLKLSGSFTLRSGRYVIAGRVGEDEIRGVYQQGMCRVDFFWKKI